MTEENRWTRGGWRSPAGLSSIAAVAGVLITAVGILVTLGGKADPAPSPPPASSPQATTATGTYFFVYGTTMPGHLRHTQIERFVAEARRDSVPGRLYDSGAGYPAATFGAGPEKIQGYVLKLRPEYVSEALRTMTAMEAGWFHPTTVTTTNGITATAYEWIESTNGLEVLTGMWDREEH